MELMWRVRRAQATSKGRTLSNGKMESCGPSIFGQRSAVPFGHAIRHPERDVEWSQQVADVFLLAAVTYTT
jgi:hypothetical protein